MKNLALVLVNGVSIVVLKIANYKVRYVYITGLSNDAPKPSKEKI